MYIFIVVTISAYL